MSHLSWVFAYGSNMHLPDLRRFLTKKGVDEPGPVRAEPAILENYQLVWNYISPARKGGAANVAPQPGAALHGVGLQVTPAWLAGIDVKEGHPARYRRRTVTLSLTSAEKVEAWLYVVQPEFCTPETVRPTAAYLNIMVEGAEAFGLPEDYLAALRKIPTT